MSNRERIRRIRRARRWIMKQGWLLRQNDSATGFMTTKRDGTLIYGGFPEQFSWTLEDVEDYIRRLKSIMILANLAVDVPASSGMATINPVWIASILFSAVCIGFGWYIVRLDHHVEELRKEVMKHENAIGKLQNADISCTNDQTILKQDMSKIRGAILKLITRKRLRKFLAAGASKSLPD